MGGCVGTQRGNGRGSRRPSGYSDSTSSGPNSAVALRGEGGRNLGGATAPSGKRKNNNYFCKSMSKFDPGLEFLRPPVLSITPLVNLGPRGR